jgi:hypothetical protein
MDAVTEAAQILTRLFEALARRSGKTLNARSREDIKRACELLASAGEELDDLLDELPPPPAPAPGYRPAREYSTVTLPEVERWKERRDQR